MAWSRSQKPCETVRSILAKTPSLDVTNPVYIICEYILNRVILSGKDKDQSI